MACGGDDFHLKKFKFWKKNSFILLRLIFLCNYCSINLERQSEYSRLRPDTSSLVYFGTYGTDFSFWDL